MRRLLSLIALLVVFQSPVLADKTWRQLEAELRPCTDKFCPVCLRKRVVILEQKILDERRALGMPVVKPLVNESLEKRVDWIGEQTKAIGKELDARVPRV